MQINDSFVQEAALEIFSSLPPSAENLTVITGALALTPDASLIKPTLEELKRYLNTSWENRVHRFLTELVAHGPHFSSQAASESLLPFINERSLQAYEKTLKRLRPTSRAYQNLEATLREYYLLRQGA